LMAAYGSSQTSGDTRAIEFNPVFNSGWTPEYNTRIPPGYENFFINLASDLFSQPHGELIVMRDNHSRIIQTFYLEQCYVPAHNLAVDAQGLIWQESVQIQYERLVPVKVHGMEKMVDPGNVFNNDTALVNVEANLSQGSF